MTAYNEPDQKFIMEQLKKAGADSNTQVAGAFWIANALRGGGHKKTPVEEVDKIKKAIGHLEKAMGLINECDPWFHLGGGMDELVTQRVDKAAQWLKWTTINYPGGHGEKANSRLIDALRAFFVSEGLKITLSESSPFVRIVSHCIRSDSTCLEGSPDTAKRIISRLYKSVDLQETSEEKADRESKEQAHAAYVRRLTRKDKPE